MLVVQTLNDGSDILEPISIVLINSALSPFIITREVLSNFIHILVALLFIILPNCMLGAYKILEHILELVFKLGEVKQQSKDVVLKGFTHAAFNNFSELLVLAVLVQH